MKKLFFLALFWAVTAASAFSQKEDKAIKAVINRFFEGIHTGDTALLRSACTAAPVLQSYMADESGELTVMTEPFADFLVVIAAPTKNKYEERIKFENIEHEKSLASVWTPYTFFVNDKISHCGTNSFQLVKTPEGWKIQYILDTRRRQGCK